MFDHQLSPRLGQRVPAESSPVRKVDSAANRPEAPHDGAIIWRTDLDALEIFDDETDQWLSTKASEQQLAVVGEVKMWLAGGIPAGYLLLDGRAVDRGDYADLFALWGTTFGAGDGSLTFTLPDMRSRLPIGAGTFAALATADALTESARTLRHSHGAGTIAGASAGAHAHTIPAQILLDQQNTTTGGTAGRLEGSAPNLSHNHGGATGSSGAHAHTVSGSTADSGASALPYFAVNFIVKH